MVAGKEDNNKEFNIPMRLMDFAKADIPQYSEKPGRDGWIEYGADNNFPNYLLSLLSKSAKHNSVVKGKAQMIGGNGIDLHNLSPEAIHFVKNPYNEMDLEEIVARISYDLEWAGGFVLNIVWSKDNSKIAEINYVNPQFLRVHNPDPQFPQVEKYWLCEDWEKWRTKKKPVLYDGFSMTDRTNKSQILYVKEYRPGKIHYAEPDYISGVNWIELEWEISQYHKSGIQQGFSNDMRINFPGGRPSDEEMDRQVRRITSQYSGARANGKTIFTFSEGDADKATFDIIEPNGSDKRFIELNKEVTEGIMSSHRVCNPDLFGIHRDNKSMFGKSDLLDSLEMLQSQYITPKQSLIEKTLNRLARINGINDKITLSKYELEFTKLDLKVTDVLAILTAPVSTDQKIALLVSNGFEESVAEKLAVDNTPKPAVVPPSADTKNNPQ